MLKETLQDEVIDPTISDVWRASLVGEPCEAYLCHTRLGHQPSKMEARVRHLLDDGKMHEGDVVARLINGGIDVRDAGEDQPYVHCIDGPVKINGHPDGTLHNVPKELQKLDWADENFKWTKHQVLEITANNGNVFRKYATEHMRGVNWRKYVQTHLYVGSIELRELTNYSVIVVKNKANSALYEEGLTYDKKIVDAVVEKLLRVEDLCSKGKVSSMRCDDWHMNTCRFAYLCYPNVVEELKPVMGKGFLDGEKLLEVQDLRDALALYDLSKSHKIDYEESRAMMAEILDNYECEGVIIDGRKVVWQDSHYSGINNDMLKTNYPKVWEDVRVSKPTRFVSVRRV